MESPPQLVLGRLVGLTPQTGQNEWDIWSHQPSAIGRGPTCDFQVSDGNVSSVHCRFYTRQVQHDWLVYCKDVSTYGTLFNGHKIGRDNSVLLFDGCILHLSKEMVYKFIQVFPPTDHSNPLYTRNLIIGSGSQSTIFLAATMGNDTRQLACKTIKTKSLDRQVAENVASELGLLKQIHHPCILRAIAIDEMVDGWVHVIMPIYHGGTLQDYVLRRQTLQEDQYQFIFYQLVLAVTYLHNKRIVHRDLKPENIFVVSDIAVPRVVIGDFGLADYLEEGASLSGVVGTLAYSAPEVLTGKDYDNKVDAWSLGAMLYFLATSNHAFMSENVDHHTVEELILKGAYDTNGAKWNEVSDGAKELIARLLTVDPKERMDLSACLDTPWFCRILSLLERLYEATQSEVP